MGDNWALEQRRAARRASIRKRQANVPQLDVVAEVAIRAATAAKVAADSTKSECERLSDLLMHIASQIDFAVREYPIAIPDPEILEAVADHCVSSIRDAYLLLTKIDDILNSSQSAFGTIKVECWLLLSMAEKSFGDFEAAWNISPERFAGQHRNRSHVAEVFMTIKDNYTKRLRSAAATINAAGKQVQFLPSKEASKILTSSADAALKSSADAPQAHLTDSENNILEALRTEGKRMNGESLGNKAMGNYNSNTKSLLSSLVKRGLITNKRDVNPPGYGLPAWP